MGGCFGFFQSLRPHGKTAAARRPVPLSPWATNLYNSFKRTLPKPPQHSFCMECGTFKGPRPIAT
eukprot:2953768-Amphidinium_carterae.1